ncbi:hypothetical protein LshimejAT787_0601560 [Lyophyllum shimeji]|uniref:Uncharacterized protein n=1 Tax=Lyophyllum shimeji TaxID=47721 RepID=A0A9P3UL94_LYOSH|nr:hypothetical protein LshimejAT787_0601560 [Lyophyllum shimeji]
MESLHGPGILLLLRINGMYTHLTTLRLKLAHPCELHCCGNDFPIHFLRLCPSLTEFSYTSPSSVEVFQYLPPSLRVLELAVILPQVPTTGSTAVPAFPPSSPLSPTLHQTARRTSSAFQFAG